MKKTLIIVSILIVIALFISGAFLGGLLVGHITGGARGRAVTPEPSVPIVIEPGDPPATEGVLPPIETTPPITGDNFDYELLEDVLALLERQYYGEIPDSETLAHGAIRGMLATLDDPYTSFIEPEIAEIMKEDASGEFEGIGAMVTMRDDGHLEVVSLLPGQPAEGAGVMPGDLILAVGEQSIVGMGLYEAISYVRGPAGTDAVLEIARSGRSDTFIITVTRARIEIAVVEYEILDDDIAYLRLLEFDARASQRVEDALEELLAQEPRALIFDLRDNPGGWLDQAIKVADIFLEEGLVAIERDSSGRESRFYSYDGGVGEDIPLVVLVNGGSASASEIVAGAIQDRGRGILIGRTTLGKGSVQRPNSLRDGSELRVTIARWYTPNEQVLHDNGLAPNIDVEIPAPLEDGERPEDTQLQRAIEYLLEGQ